MPELRTISRRQLLTGAGVGVAAVSSRSRGLQAQTPPSRPVVFSHTTVVNVDVVQDDVALAVQGDTIVAIGPTDPFFSAIPRAGLRRTRQGALPGPDQLSRAPGRDPRARLQRGLRIPELRAAAGPARQPAVRGRADADGDRRRARSDPLRHHHHRAERVEHRRLGVGAGADRAARACSPSRFAIARTSPARCRRRSSRGARRRRFSARLRDEGLQRISDLFTAWHGKQNGRISVFPAANLAENASPELLQAVRAFAETHDLGYTIHLSQSRAEVDFMVRHHGVRPAGLSRPGRLPRSAAVRGALPLRRRRRHRPAGPDAPIISHQAAMAANRGVIPPIAALRAAGCPIAHGTDNNTNDLFEVMRVALLTERISRHDAIPGTRGRSRRTCSRMPRAAARGRCGSARASARSRWERRRTSS